MVSGCQVVRMVVERHFRNFQGSDKVPSRIHKASSKGLPEGKTRLTISGAPLTWPAWAQGLGALHCS